MQFLHSMLRVNNLDDSLTFYCQHLGLQEISRYDNEKGRFTLVFLAAADDMPEAKHNKSPLLELTYNWDKAPDEERYQGGRNFGHIAFSVDNIYDTCQKLADAGIVILRPPRDGHMAFIKSPDGISIELLQKGNDLEPCEPWLSMSSQGSW